MNVRPGGDVFGKGDRDDRLLGWVRNQFEHGDDAGLGSVRDAVGVAIGVLTSLGDGLPDVELLASALDDQALEELSFGSLTLANALVSAMAADMGTTRWTVLQALAIAIAGGEQ